MVENPIMPQTEISWDLPPTNIPFYIRIVTCKRRKKWRGFGQLVCRQHYSLCQSLGQCRRAKTAKKRASKQKTAEREKKRRRNSTSAPRISPAPTLFSRILLGPLSYYLEPRTGSYPKMFRGGKENVEKENKLKGPYIVVSVKFSVDPFLVLSPALQVSKLI